MRVKKKSIILLLFLIFITSFISLIFASLNKEQKFYNITAIIRGKSNESWSIIKEGMEQAATEMNVNLSFITLLEENNSVEQTQVINREIEGNVDAILVSPTNYEDLTNIIEKVNKKVPVVLFESNINTKANIPFISCDNEELGEKLAEEVIRNGNLRKKITIFRNNKKNNSVQDRIDGFVKELENSKNYYEIIDLPKEEEEIISVANGIIEGNNKNVLVTFEPDILEIIAKAKKAYNDNNMTKSNIEIYGSGSTSLMVYLTEEKIINGIAMQNEMSLGYLSIKAAVAKIEKEKVETNNINSTIINSENIYSKENERILFPIVR